MNVGLIDVDSHNFPNLALMKISGYHKSHGDHVEWWNGLKHYDIVYKSKIFDDTYSHDMEYAINADEIIKGGTGYDLNNVLPDEIEHHFPDYDLYGGVDQEHLGISQEDAQDIARFVSLAKRKEMSTLLRISMNSGTARRKSSSWIPISQQVKNARSILTV